MNINKMIFKYCFEIVCLVFIVCITYPVWEILGESKGATIAASYEDYDSDSLTFYVDRLADFENIYPVSDKDVNKSNYTSVNIVNNTTKAREYNLVMTVEKNSTLNVDSLKISVNGEVNYLKDLYVSSDNYLHYYFINNVSSIDEGTVYNYRILLWLSEETGNEMQDKTLNFNFSLVNY